ncbi:retropepsin-like aspartic protease family protein [Novosphingobium aquimarinum]|uniref:retropepsin-like aspartic protease family protein n=1 Tax=Novosphingobium aquimarinum TaxID=2682494 RepID=UPI0012EB29C8|nr:TIGR02281 family clan AA aspartic protease [Novosphingobium aquimarinum]
MRKLPILALLVSAALVGWMMPDLSRLEQDDTAQSDRIALVTPPQDRESAREAWLSGETVLPRSGDGHFYANVQIDSRDLRMLVDTGASVVALTGEDAEAIGLTWSDADLREIGRGASGPVQGVPVMLDRIELGGLEARNIRAAIVPEGLDVSLLGQSFLSQLPGVRIDGDRMMLGGG